MLRKVIIVFSILLGSIMVLTACTPVAAPVSSKEPMPAQATELTDGSSLESNVTPETAVTAVSEGPQMDTLPEIDPASLQGAIYSAGSSTVYPLSEAIAENFKIDGFNGEIKIDSIGTGAGFERFCGTGETDIANASRPIKEAEIGMCKAIHRTPLEFRVGMDAIAIVVSKDNNFLTDLTLEELGMIFSNKSVKWSDIRPDWPSEEIQRFTPGTDSGTFDFFVEVVLQKPNKIEKLDDAKKIALEADNLQTSEDDNVLVKGIEGSPYAIGYFGFAYYQNEAQSLKAISIDGVSPSEETAESGEYKLARPLIIYSDAGIMKEKTQVAGFINYYLTNVNDLITEVGYFPSGEEALQASRQAWLNAMK